MTLSTRLWVLGAATLVDDLLRRLSLTIKLPVARRILVGRVEDWSLEKSVIHV